jgi:hypothetical protein
VAPTPTDGTDVTTHNEQEHGNHTLTQHDLGHSTTMTSIPLQQRGNDNCIAYSPLYANLGTRTARPRWHRGAWDEAWLQHVAPADGEAKRSTPIVSLRYRGNCSHRIRRKMATPEATFFVFLFHLFPILFFYHEYNRSPLLRNYKRRGKGNI